jgi:hypothetical protein
VSLFALISGASRTAIRSQWGGGGGYTQPLVPLRGREYHGFYGGVRPLVSWIVKGIRTSDLRSGIAST